MLPLFEILPRRRRLQLLTVLGLTLATAVAELGTVGAVVPLLSSLVRLGGHAAVAPPGTLGATWISGLSHRGVLVSALLFGLFAIVAGAFRLQLVWSTQKLTFGIGHELSTGITRRILAQPYAFHMASHSSTLIAALEKVQALVFNVLMPQIQMTTGAILCVVLSAIMIYLDVATASIAIVGFGILYLIISLLSRRRLDANANTMGATYDERIKIIQDSLGGIRDIIIDGSDHYFVEAFRRVDRRLTDAITTNNVIAAAPRVLLESFSVLLVIALAIAAADRHGGFVPALPLLGAVILGCQRLLPYAQQVYQSWAQIRGSSVIVRQVIDLTSLPLSSDQPRDQIPAIPFHTSIELNGVGFTYPGRTDEALADVSVSLPRGALIGVAGRSGSGKSTFADLVMGLLVPSRGTVAVDGNILTTSNRQGWWKNIAHVPQSPFLISDTIARNIAFGVPVEAIDMPRVIEASRKAHLDEHVQSLANGYETIIGERGKTLSGGQQQRLGLARAIYKNAPLLVLDEPTSALDIETEASIFETVYGLRALGQTILLISHNPSVLEQCTMVVELEGGRMIGGA